jgi:hypothetical protein
MATRMSYCFSCYLTYYLIDFRKLFILGLESSLAAWLRDIDLDLLVLCDLGPRLADLRERDLLRLIDFNFSLDETEARRFSVLVVPRVSLESDRFRLLLLEEGASLLARRRVDDRLRPDRLGLSTGESALPIRKGERR